MDPDDRQHDVVHHFNLATLHIQDLFVDDVILQGHGLARNALQFFQRRIDVEHDTVVCQDLHLLPGQVQSRLAERPVDTQVRDLCHYVVVHDHQVGQPPDLAGPHQHRPLPQIAESIEFLGAECAGLRGRHHGWSILPAVMTGGTCTLRLFWVLAGATAACVAAALSIGLFPPEVAAMTNLKTIRPMSENR